MSALLTFLGGGAPQKRAVVTLQEAADEVGVCLVAALEALLDLDGKELLEQGVQASASACCPVHLKQLLEFGDALHWYGCG